MQVTSRFFVRSTIALLVVGLLVLLGIVGATIWLGERAKSNFDAAIQSRDARAAAVELRNAVLGAESSQRGYVLTGNEIYLAPYDTAKTQAQRYLEAVKQTAASNAQTALGMERLVMIIAEKFTEMDQTIALKSDRRDEEAVALVRTNQGKALMDEAQVFFSALIRAADTRLITVAEEQRASATSLRWVSILGGLIIVAVIGGAAIAVILYTRELAAARDEVATLAAGLEERVKDRTADLARANDEIQRFAYIVTHDLRAPLVNIMGFTTELEGGVQSLQALIDKSGVGASADPVAEAARVAATEDLPEAIGFIRSSTKKMDSLINAILKLSREGLRTLRPEQVDLSEVARSSAAAIQHQLSEANGTMNIQLEVPPIVQDKMSLEHIFGNLLDNAVKYRSKDRALHIDVSAALAPGDKVAIKIADNGRGIAEQDQARVFDLFRRSGVHDQPGEGIGLAHVRSVVRNLGGDISITSRLDAGTTFHVTLPRTLRS